MEDGYALHERLAADSIPVGRLALCEVRLQDNALWPWLVLVPRRPDVREIHELVPADRVMLIEETALAARVLQALFAADKINVGALGNIVPQLHVHVIARRRDDPAWPGPVWGSGHHTAYDLRDRAERIGRLRDAIERG